MDDADFLRLAYDAAHRLSEDPATQNGAVLVSGEGTVLGIGANRFPRGVEKYPPRLMRPLKYDFLIHAEADAIAAAAMAGAATKGATLYCPWAACPPCAQLIIQAGIARLVTHSLVMDKTPERWRGPIKIAMEMLSEAGVKQIDVARAVLGPEIRFDGVLWTP